MSKGRNLSKELKGGPDYDVGYAKPPVDTRFPKGVSGNPRGRPKGSRNKRSGPPVQQLEDIILAEAKRGIAVKDGDRTVRLSMAQAIVRAIAVNAAKGQPRAQKLFTEMLSATEASRRVRNEQWLETAIEYKFDWTNELERRKRLGVTGLREPLPHPDHVEIDFIEGTARIIGPVTKEEKADFDAIIANRHLLIEEIRDTRRAIEKATDPKEHRRLEKEFEEQLGFYGFINKLDPSRN